MIRQWLVPWLWVILPGLVYLAVALWWVDEWRRRRRPARDCTVLVPFALETLRCPPEELDEWLRRAGALADDE